MQQIIVFDEAKYDSILPNNTSFYDYTQTTTLNYEIKCYGKYDGKKLLKLVMIMNNITLN